MNIKYIPCLPKIYVIGYDCICFGVYYENCSFAFFRDWSNNKLIIEFSYSEQLLFHYKITIIFVTNQMRRNAN